MGQSPRIRLKVSGEGRVRRGWHLEQVVHIHRTHAVHANGACPAQRPIPLPLLSLTPARRAQHQTGRIAQRQWREALLHICAVDGHIDGVVQRDGKREARHRGARRWRVWGEWRVVRGDEGHVQLGPGEGGLGFLV